MKYFFGFKKTAIFFLLLLSIALPTSHFAFAQSSDVKINSLTTQLTSIVESLKGIVSSIVGGGNQLAAVISSSNNQVIGYSFDEGTGNMLNDSSGSNNDGGVSGAIWVDGVSGTALYFDGVNDVVSIGDTDALSGGAGVDLSWSFWFNPDALPENQYHILKKDKDSAYKDWGFTYTADGKINFYYENGANKFDPCPCLTTTTLSPDSWHHVAATFDGDSRQLKLFVNGSLDNTFTLDYDLPNTDTDLLIGKRRYSRADRYAGKLDELRIYSGVLSSSEVQGLYDDPGQNGNNDSVPVVESAPVCTSFSYSSWGSCQADGIQTRNLLSSSPSGCEGGEPIVTQSCEYQAPVTEQTSTSEPQQYIPPPQTLTESGDVIFADNFNNLPDMPLDGRYTYKNYPTDPSVVPSGWDFIYTSNSNETNPPGEILSGQGIGGGKVFRVYDESQGTPRQWGHDIQLMKHFGENQYQEIWIQAVIKFNPDLNTNNFNAAKIFRMGHYNPQVADGSARTNIVNTNNQSDDNNGYGATTAGLVFYDIKKSSGIWHHRIAERGSADATYKIGRTYDRETTNKKNDTVGGTDFWIVDEQGNRKTAWDETFGDGNWHTYEFRLVMNSTVDAEDGIIEIYLDGIKQGSVTNVPWRQSGIKSNVVGFNAFSLGGNANALWDGQSNAEQWFYDFDSVQVCTSRCPATNGFVDSTPAPVSTQTPAADNNQSSGGGSSSEESSPVSKSSVQEQFVDSTPAPVSNQTPNTNNNRSSGGGSSDKNQRSVDSSSNKESLSVRNSSIRDGFSFERNISFIRPTSNDSEDVKNLQRFLNEFEGEGLEVSGVYDDYSKEAIKKFQRKYKREILDVWNLDEATGFVGITTRLKMNFLLKGQTSVCPVFKEYNGGINGIKNSLEIGETQKVLTELGMYSGPINNTWDAATNEAMITFQENFREVMLDPWEISKGTGYKYKTTNKFLNYFAGCDTGSVYLEGFGVYEGI